MEIINFNVGDKIICKKYLKTDDKRDNCIDYMEFYKDVEYDIISIRSDQIGIVSVKNRELGIMCQYFFDTIKDKYHKYHKKGFTGDRYIFDYFYTEQEVRKKKLERLKSRS